MSLRLRAAKRPPPDGVSEASGMAPMAPSLEWQSSSRLEVANGKELDMRSGCDNGLGGGASLAPHSNSEARVVGSCNEEWNKCEPSGNQNVSGEQLRASYTSSRANRLKWQICGPKGSPTGLRSDQIVVARAGSSIDRSRDLDSVTSDYFSSTHNSPVVRAKSSIRRRVEARRASASSAQQNRRTTIYENPVYLSDSSEFRGRGAQPSTFCANMKPRGISSIVEQATRRHTERAGKAKTSVNFNSNYTQPEELDPDHTSCAVVAYESSVSRSSCSSSDDTQSADHSAGKLAQDRLLLAGNVIRADRENIAHPQQCNPFSNHLHLKASSQRKCPSPQPEGNSHGHIMDQSQRHPHYYYSTNTATTNSKPKNLVHLNSQASSQRTNETCDESPSNNTDESNKQLIYSNYQQTVLANDSDYHYYQVLLPTDRSVSGDNHTVMGNKQASSPCRGIQRIVSSIFSSSSQLHYPVQQEPEPSRPAIGHLPPIPSINQSLVSNEPLIRSSSWQNKTLIDLRGQQPQHQQPASHFLESSLSQKTLPANSDRLDAPHPGGEHLYCGVGSLRPDPREPRLLAPEEAFKTDSLSHSFHTLIDKMNEHHFYQLQSPSLEPAHLGRLSAPRGLARGRDSGTSSDSALGKLAQGTCSPAGRLCLLVLLLGAFSCILMLALLSTTNYRPFLLDTTTNTDKQATANSNPNSVLYPQFRPPPPPPPASLPSEIDLNRYPHVAPSLSVFYANHTPSSVPALATRAPQALTPPTTAIPEPAPSTQGYWLNAEPATERQCPRGHDENPCSLRGRCQTSGVCSCLAGFSGPTCSIANCPNDCSQRGHCQLRRDSVINNLGAGVSNYLSGAQYLTHSLAFASVWSSSSRNSVCPSRMESELNQTWAFIQSHSSEEAPVYDYRLEWQCVCEEGFSGSDCSQKQELHCDNDLDDDQDGLVDCEDDDCCMQPVCRGNHMCFKSPEPTRVLETEPWSAFSTRDPGQTFFAHTRFLIANDSVQSYAQEQAYDKNRVAVVRGKVVKFKEHRDAQHNGIVSVRVGVVESAQFGFSLSRNDGYFDMLVNGNEWITLHFHRNAYVPIKRKIFVKAHTINTLEEDVEMKLANSLEGHIEEHAFASKRLDASYGLQFVTESYKLLNTFKRADERKRSALFECLIDGSTRNSFVHSLEPSIVDPSRVVSHEELKLFVLTNSVAFQTKLDLHQDLELVYNSAHFPLAASVVKPSISIKLLPDKYQSSFGPYRLAAVSLQLDIEGQSWRERFKPLARLSYQFAWNRRDIFQQKVYGFGELRVRVGYEYELVPNSSASSIWAECLAEGKDYSQQGQSLAQLDLKLKSTHYNLDKRVVWFERSVYLEAHQLNQHSDLGKWTLESSSRLDRERDIIYFGSGWSLPYTLVYPPIVSDPIALSSEHIDTSNSSPDSSPDQMVGRLMAEGPNSTIFLILRETKSRLTLGKSSNRLVQLDSSGRRRLIDVPLSILTSKLGIASRTPGTEQLNELPLDDIQLAYNNYLASLYVSSTLAARIVQVSYTSLLVLNKTLASGSATAPAEDEIDIEPLCGFGRQTLSISNSPLDSFKSATQTRLLGPHSMTLDEERQVLYFVDGPANLMALDLSSNQVTLLQAIAPKTTREDRPSSEAGNRCLRSNLRLRFRDYKAHKMHSLLWSRSDSSLYFIDQNLVLALRQDFALEIVAAGSSQTRASSSSFPVSCFVGRQLGLIKALARDQPDDHILVLHQWTGAPGRLPNGESRQTGRFFLAKLSSGIRADDPTEVAYPMDLHSASSVWNPLVQRMADGRVSTRQPINWTELASTSSSLVGQQWSSSGQSKIMIAFIHLSGGFNRVDSIEINSDGSIFVLDSRSQALRLVASYSTNDFNQFERHDVNINRLFAPTGIEPTSGQTLAISQTYTKAHKLDVLHVQNPISRELIEFHAYTGLQLSLTAPKNNINRIKSEFYYRIFTTNNKTTILEDDRNDLYVQTLALDFLLANSEITDQLASVFVRLDRITHSTGNQLELQRLYQNSQIVLKFIRLDQQMICELNSDTSGALNSIKQIPKHFRMDVIYDAMTYLLRDLITKRIGETVDHQLASDNNNQPPISDWKQLKRIVYDRVFYQYCDQFIVNV